MRSITAQVCEVNKPLLSVRKVMAGGSRVVLDEDGSYIESKATGEEHGLKNQEACSCSRCGCRGKHLFRGRSEDHKPSRA